MKDLRTFTLDTVTAALIVELQGADPDELRDRAYSFIAIAEERGLMIEELIRWIRTPAPAKDWSLVEFRNYADLQKRLKAGHVPLRPGEVKPL